MSEAEGTRAVVGEEVIEVSRVEVGAGMAWVGGSGSYKQLSLPTEGGVGGMVGGGELKKMLGVQRE
ncbi:hypothetical protein [Janibacter melonis]|uniref:hypothetical protein n=1 Tax=Janibacter melonis TaxID=262209 RepID=UPI00174B026B|nr:hypothetical protein [Janibacter melonis]